MSDATDRAAALAELIEKAEVYELPALGTLGTKQSEVAQVIGTITLAGNGAVTVTANGMAGSPKTLNVAVLLADTAYQVATKIRTALLADADINGFFDIGGVGVNIQLTAKTEAANDATMNIAIANGTCTGLTNAPTSITDEEGEAEDSTKINAILDRFKRGTEWSAGLTVVQGDYILPLTPNGRVYRVTAGGVLGSTEPYNNTFPDTVTDGSATLEDAGEATTGRYDVLSAVIAAWEAKAATSSRYLGSGSANMGRLYDNCVRMITYYQNTPMLG